MGHIWEGGDPSPELLAQRLEDIGAGSIQTHLKRCFHGWPLIDTAHQNLRLRVFPIDLFLQSPNQVVGLVLVGSQDQTSGPAGHTFYISAQVVIELGRALANRPVHPSHQWLGSELLIDLRYQRQRVFDGSTVGEFDVQIHMIAISAWKELQGQGAETEEAGQGERQRQCCRTNGVANRPIQRAPEGIS